MVQYLSLLDMYNDMFYDSGLGAYDFISQSWGRDGSGTYPPPNLPTRSWLEAGRAIITPIEVDGTYELESLTSSDRVYKIDTGYPPGEYLLLEN